MVRTAGTVLLVAGYPTAVAAATRLVPAFRRRRPAAVVAFEAGTAAVVVGWALHERWVPATLNVGALAGLAAYWWLTGRRAARRGTGR